MRTKRRSLGFWLSLLLYGLVLTGVLLVVRFPAEKVEGYLAVKIATLSHGAAVDIGQCGYTFPAMLRCDHLAIGTSGKKEEMVVLENLTISPLTSGFGLKYNLAGEIAGGTFRTVAEFSPLNKTVALRSLALASLDLSRAGFVKQGLQREISGLLDFSGSMAVSLDGGGVITQEGKLSVREGDFVLRQQILLADSLQMAPMEVKLSYGKGVLQLHDGSLRGKQLVVTFAGELQPDDTLATWKMALKGSMTPVQEYMGGNPQLQRVVKRLQRQFTGDSLPYMVSGSLGVPHFRFGSQ